MTENDDIEKNLHADAERVAEELWKDPSTLAVILSGPLAVGKASAADKLYFAVITNNEDGAIEHHFLDEGWGGVERRIEMAKFPVTVARWLLRHGYVDMVSYKSLEAFRCGMVLRERDGVGAEMIEGAARHIPERAFIGEGLHGAVSALDDAVSLLHGWDYPNAVLVAREAALKAVGVLVRDLVEERGLGLLDAAVEVLPPEQLALFQRIMGLEAVDAAAADEATRRAKEFAELALREIGVDPDRVLDTTKGAAS